VVTNEDEKARVANIFDVARLAGVSHQTVSRVLNDLPNVRPATRERVEKAIKQLRYTPSQAARALVTRRSRTIGLITTGGPDFGPSSTALHFNDAARDARYAVSMASMLDSDPAAVARGSTASRSTSMRGPGPQSTTSSASVTRRSGTSPDPSIPRMPPNAFAAGATRWRRPGWSPVSTSWVTGHQRADTDTAERSPGTPR
jgi:transcriptional regulator with XRE-family HTH domain